MAELKNQLIRCVDLSGDMNIFLSPLFPILQPTGFSRASITLGEALVLLLALRQVEPTNVFEFGTFHGETTRMLAGNLPNPDARIFTLDIKDTDGIRFIGVDEQIAEESIGESVVFDDPRITRLFCDSLHFDSTPYHGKMQYIFIDGNHALEYVRADTANALQMLDRTRPGVILWHDFENPDFPELTDFLVALAKALPNMYHVERPDHTSLVFYLNQAAEGERVE